jgi:nucleoside-diphosphate-sugar epimerase
MGKVIPELNHVVLGQNGFIGGYLYKYLQSKGHILFPVTKGIDLRDYKNVREIVRGMDYVWSFAASMGGIGFFSKENYYPPIDNYLIDLNVLRACEEEGVKRLFYPSSACAYNTYFEGEPLEESMLNWSANPDQMYGWEKLSMIKLMRNAPFDIRVGVLHTIYGENQAYEGRKAKFPPQIAYKMIQAVKTGEIEVWGDGTQTRTFLYIDDAVKKIYEVMMADSYHGEVNIGSDVEVSVNDVIKICSEILHIDPEIIYDTTKPTGPARRLCSNEKFNKYYKTRDSISLPDGFERLINYIRRYV